MEEILSWITKAKVFSTLDAKEGESRQGEDYSLDVLFVLLVTAILLVLLVSFCSLRSVKMAVCFSLAAVS